MRLRPGCPRCAGVVTGSGTAWDCESHGPIGPLWRAPEDPDYDSFAEHLTLSRPLPAWLPWPLPAGWRVSDFGCVTDGRGSSSAGPRAAVVSCTGPSDLDGVVELSIVTEEPGVGLGARCAAVEHTDPGREAGVGPPPTRLKVDGATVPMWTLSTEDDDETLDRSVLVGEAQGRWLWVVVRPASAVLLLPDLGGLFDVSGLGPPLVGLPFLSSPRSW